ncbi:hypothetical protein JRQ81_019906, partial [Phrynocephalus forsythii]
QLGYVSNVLSDSYQSQWQSFINKKIRSVGIPRPYFDVRAETGSKNSYPEAK